MTCTFGQFSVAIVTPFYPDNIVDCNSVQRLAKHLVANGCDAVSVSGTTGEASATHRKEKRDPLLAVREAVGSDIKIMAGVSSNDTARTLAMARVAQDAKADSLLACAPYYDRPSQEGIYQHFRAVHAGSDLPIMVYDIPERTGIAIEGTTLDRLATLKRIKGVKGTMTNVAEGTTRMCHTGLEWYSGDDALNLFLLAGEATGVLFVVGYIEGRRITCLLDAVAAGNLELTREIDVQLAPANRVIMDGDQGATHIKQAVFALGLIDDPRPRLPLAAPGDSEIAAIRDLLRTQRLVSA